MDDLSAMISSVLSDPDKVRQIQEMAAGLGFGGGQNQAQPAPPPPAAPAPDLSALAALLSSAGLGPVQQSPPASYIPPPQPAPGPDLTALAGLLSGALAQNNQNLSPPQPQTGPDLSALAGMLGGVLGQSGQQQANSTPDLSGLAGLTGGAGSWNSRPPPGQSGGFDVSALTNMLGGPQQGGGPGLPFGIDMDTIMKLGQAMSSMQANRQSVDLLLALKPRLNDRRAKKVDDAIRVMQIVQFLPLLKESGIFQGLDGLLGGLGGPGGLSGILNNIGVGPGGLGGMLSGLGGSGGLGGILNGILGR